MFRTLRDDIFAQKKKPGSWLRIGFTLSILFLSFKVISQLGFIVGEYKQETPAEAAIRRGKERRLRNDVKAAASPGEIELADWQSKNEQRIQNLIQSSKD